MLLKCLTRFLNPVLNLVDVEYCKKTALPFDTVHSDKGML